MSDMAKQFKGPDGGIHTMQTHFSGSSNNLHEFGTSFIVDKSIDHSVATVGKNVTLTFKNVLLSFGKR